MHRSSHTVNSCGPPSLASHNPSGFCWRIDLLNRNAAPDDILNHLAASAEYLRGRLVGWQRPAVGFKWCFRHQLLLPRPYLVLTKPLRLDIQCQRGASVKIGWKYLDD